ncbi:MAG: hypothetical protein A3G08_01510 [Candidatus Magasanikbacteria bacterium RIFCSPLOWO2_12_FULL_47_9b]|nr:MAG: hypothetical protein A3I74_03215 [Candidatus Magasanikbacteria bacterium RIFCSPLOWO2_02_FULL_47_16]OGH80221.1 MAG: hypothetical protein A3C10_03495 [Candidatus Magasanikbacteria bacterium RIFCSPHIGHO2_02_FULL_48_18]OGH82714.1 MAG: hypothetical protein A3G08_01510 [Candidatus Magasanikbacteria bacterium RIFCSPLOWO2_12_FULL_47_9b]
MLVIRITKEKDTEAFSELYDLYIERMYRFVAFKVSKREEAEDITGDVFLRVWEYLTRSANDEKHIRSFRGLIYQIARNAIIDHYRKQASRQEYPLESMEDVQGQSSMELMTEVDNLLDTQAQMQHLARAIKKMKLEYQEIVFLRYTEGLSTAEIAHILGKKKTAVRVTLHRAMNVLKKIIEEEKKANDQP